MVRNSAHRCALVKSAISSRKREIENSRRRDCVVKKHLVKVAETEKQETILVVFFDFKIPSHHRRKFFSVDNHFHSLCPKRDADLETSMRTLKNLPISSFVPSNVTSLPLSVLPHTIPSCFGAMSSQSTSYTLFI